MPKRMIDIGPYFATDAGGRPGLGQLNPLEIFMGGGAAPAIPGLSPGTSWPAIPGIPPLPAGLQNLDLPGLLANVPSMGIYTPWAWQEADLSWKEIQKPDTNIGLWEYSGVAMGMAALGLGQPGFVAILTKEPRKLGLVDGALFGTPYKLFSGVACYRQDDKSPSPTPWFLYWAQLRDPGDGAGGNSSIDLAAQSIGGTVVFAVQLDANTTTTRGAPTPGAFEGIFESKFKTDIVVEVPGGPLPPPPEPIPGPKPQPGPAPGPAPQPPPEAPATKAGIALPLVVGAGSAVLAYFLLRKK